MRKISFVPALLILVIAACNDGGSKAEKLSAMQDSPTTAAADTMHHTMDTTQLSMELPAIPAGARVFFVNLKNNQKVKSPFKVEMGVEGIALDSAGKIRLASGHHHILVDAGDSLAAGTVVPKDSTHLHFGNAQKEAQLTLPKGKHHITLQYADGIHRSYGNKLSASIDVIVE
jgi:Domain of unknown function (DUF4399)